jgi:tetratricopeptide (TPR) repeat protein
MRSTSADSPTELPALVAAVGAAGATRRDAHAHQLAWTLATFCGHRGRWREWVLAQHVAVASARHCGDAAVLAEALRLLGQAYSTGHQFEQASENYLLALDAFTRTGDLAGRAHVHFDLALLMDRQGRPAEAAPHAQRSLEDFRAAGDNHGVAVALNAVGWYHCELGDYRRGIDCCQQALSVARTIDSIYCESNALDSLGYAYHHLGRYAEAIEHYRRALSLLRDGRPNQQRDRTGPPRGQLPGGRGRHAGTADLAGGARRVRGRVPSRGRSREAQTPGTRGALTSLHRSECGRESPGLGRGKVQRDDPGGLLVGNAEQA